MEEEKPSIEDISISSKKSSVIDEIEKKSRKSNKGGNNIMKQLRHWGKKVTTAAYSAKSPNSTERQMNASSEEFANSQIDHSVTYIGCQKPELAISDAVDYLWKTIRGAQIASPFVDTIIGLSGGNTPRKIFETFSNLVPTLAAECQSDDSQENKSIDWSKVKIFLVDERYLPPNDSNLNQTMIRETLLSNDGVSIPEENLIFPDTSLPLNDCVEKYNDDLRKLLQHCDRPALVTLGLGDDGHIGSWFPPLSNQDYDLAHSVVKLAVATQQDRGLPGENRISVSMILVEMAKKKLFLLEGKNKVKTWNRITSLNTLEHLKQHPLLQVLRTENITVISHPPIASTSAGIITSELPLFIVLFGASGDLARKKILPALFVLFCDGMLPKEFHIIGFSRTKYTNDEYWNLVKEGFCYMESSDEQTEQQHKIFSSVSAGLLEDFRKRLSYMSGEYDQDASYMQLATYLDNIPLDEKTNPLKHINHLFYLALPNNLFAEAARLCRSYCWSTSGWNRFVTEKPFGHNLESAVELNKKLNTYLNESEIYRIDHYLGKEMVLNMFPLRFANVLFSHLMSWHFISAVRITCKETAGVNGRGGYFDQFGIIRDMLQNHLIQILALIAMEWPASLDGEDVRDAKVNILKQVKPFDIANTVLGQYTRSKDGSIPGYLEDKSVSSNSTAPTFCTTVLYLDSDRWQNVPFILKTGKALETKVTEVRLQLRAMGKNLFDQELPQNEIVIQIQPTEAIYIKILTKTPGYSFQLKQGELDYTVASRYKIKRIPEAYERLLNDIIVGNSRNFVRFDELFESWRIFTPGLKQIESQKIKPILYPAKSRGPPEAYNLIAKHGYRFYEGYEWSKV